MTNTQSINNQQEHNARLAAFLHAIPQSNEPTQRLSAILPDEDLAWKQGVLTTLSLIGIVQVDHTIVNDPPVRATSQTAKYMLNSLATFAQSGTPLIDEWEERGVYRLDKHDPLQNAATLLHALETRRQRIQDTPMPSRSEEVAQVLICRHNPQTGEREFLLQYDANADQYQFIGGRRKDTDTDLLATIIREIAEEMADDLIFEQDYQLDMLIEDLRPAPTVSPTFGALTEYRFRLYLMRGLQHDLTLQDDDRWMTRAEIFAASAHNDPRDQLYQLIETQLVGGFEHVPISFIDPSR